MPSRTSSLSVSKWIRKNQGKHLCHCGCKCEIEILRSHHNKGIPKYIKGHGSKTDEFRNSLSEMRKGDKNPFYGMCHTEEELNKRPSFKGVENPNYGKSHTDASKRIIGEASRERTSTDEGRERMRRQRLNQRNVRVSSIEFKMRDILSLHGYFFKIQIPICHVCIPDITIPEKRIIIQCDGDYWHNLPGVSERDHYQDKVLTENGWRVIRFWEHEINENIQDCLRKFEAIYHNTEYKSFYEQETLNEWL